MYSERLLRPRDSVPAIVRSVFALTIPAPGAVFEIEGQVLHRPKDNDRPLADVCIMYFVVHEYCVSQVLTEYWLFLNVLLYSV